LVASPNEKIVRRVNEVVNTCNSVEEAIATGVEELWDPEIEYVNPEDAVERGTRKDAAGMRTVLENLLAGAGAGATVELEELRERGDRVFTLTRIHMRGAASGIETLGPPVGTVFTIRDERILRIEWHNDVDTARASFEQGG
jgi:ketosteroid isomerase-like protein